MAVTHSTDLVKNESYVLVRGDGQVFSVVFSGNSLHTQTLVFYQNDGQPLYIFGPFDETCEKTCFTCYGEEDADKDFIFDKTKLLRATSSLENLVGTVFSRVTRRGDCVLFNVQNTEHVFALQHEKECCEKIYLEDVVGDLQDLEGTPILEAKEVHCFTPEVGPAYFYDIRTIKGSVTFRFMHEDDSNWMYSAKASLSVLPHTR